MNTPKNLEKIELFNRTNGEQGEFVDFSEQVIEGIEIKNMDLSSLEARFSVFKNCNFPESWGKNNIASAGKHVISLPDNINVADGVVVFGNYQGVRIGVIKTNGKVGTIFPDITQP